MRFVKVISLFALVASIVQAPAQASVSYGGASSSYKCSRLAAPTVTCNQASGATRAGKLDFDLSVVSPVNGAIPANGELTAEDSVWKTITIPGRWRYVDVYSVLHLTRASVSSQGALPNEYNTAKVGMSDTIQYTCGCHAPFTMDELPILSTTNPSNRWSRSNQDWTMDYGAQDSWFPGGRVQVIFAVWGDTYLGNNTGSAIASLHGFLERFSIVISTCDPSFEHRPGAVHTNCKTWRF
ncbi:MAG: hypothetical protein ACYDCC_10235 [Actinomycetota bacterium]